ncbi:MAG: hypothetical protein KF773_11040 [Deltaproteobacteria bacterium]|nr:hypothetical protein [Deltaproteobacteria bacterium]MCW5801516.1 hypothetical protein [Deltaproteobacteria bacterium]
MSLAGLRSRWPAARASLIALAIAFGLLDGCPLPEGAGSAERARRWLLQPVDGVKRDLELTQRWTLFRKASTRRFRMVVDGLDRRGAWQLLYRAGDDEHDAYGDMLAYRRMRGTYNPRGQLERGQYRRFARWMAQRVLADHPELVVARVRMERIEIRDGTYTPTNEFTMEQREIRRAP